MSTGVTGVLDYRDGSLVRRHGPQGYLDYKHYKPWLRDDFSFRCVYCLCRETWLPDGEACFGSDHVLPQSRTTEEPSNYRRPRLRLLRLQCLEERLPRDAGL